MATDSIRERIFQDMETSLQAVTGTGDYWLALRTVARGQSAPRNLDELPAVRLVAGEEEVTGEPYPVLTRALQVHATCWLHVTEDDPATLAQLAERAHADIERALLADPTRGGLAIATDLVGSVPAEDDEPDVSGSLTLTFRILYQTLRGNPASLG